MKIGNRIFGFALLLLPALLVSPVAHAKICKTGDQAEVLWKGKWFPATVLNEKDNKCYIHYTNYNDSWNEWVGSNRIRVFKDRSYNVGARVTVFWKDKWYPARVLNKRGDKLYIHYDGYGKNWDEWVGPDRYR